jgi:hypothetical protein
MFAAPVTVRVGNGPQLLLCNPGTAGTLALSRQLRFLIRRYGGKIQLTPPAARRHH